MNKKILLTGFERELEYSSVLNDTNLIAKVIANITIGEIVTSYYNENICLYGKEISYKDLVNSVSSTCVDIDKSNELLAVFEPNNLIECYYDGENQNNIIFRRNTLNKEIIWCKIVMKTFLNPENGHIMLFAYSFDVTKKMIKDKIVQQSSNINYEYIVDIDMNNDKYYVLAKNTNLYNSIPLEGKYTKIIEDIRKILIDNNVTDIKNDIFTYFSGLERIKNELLLKDKISIRFNINNNEHKIKQIQLYFIDKDMGHICLTQSDVTDIIKKEQEQKETLEFALKAALEANKAKSEFLSKMSHEIRTPINAIIGLTKLAEESENSEDKKWYLSQIEESGNYLLGLINDVLDVSKIENGKFELHREWSNPCESFEACYSMMKPLMEKKKINFIYPKYENQNVEYQWYMDTMRMKQLILNLLSNANKFTPEGGTVEFSMTNIYRENGYVVDLITIRDTGCGMSEDFLSYIGEPFSQERNPYDCMMQGTGLGITLVKQIVAAMGGTIRFESELGKGTTVNVTIMYKLKRIERYVDLEENKNKVCLKGIKILLVEDHPLNQMIATELLKRLDAKPVVANNGEEAISIFNNSKEGEFSAILMDVRMPKINGLEATKIIRKMDRFDAPTIPIIAMSANAFQDEIDIALDSGMNDYLTKPVSVNKLYTTLLKTCNKI